jgi:gamma-D-glutamyl-L-lysine dipeptidyl-peptidase
MARFSEVPPVSASLFALCLSLVQPAPAVAVRDAVVTLTVENMYAAADDGTAVVSQATLGEVVDVLETSGDFARVRTPDRYEGWIPRAAVAEYKDAAAPRYARAGRVVEVTSLMANVYRSPSVTKARPRALAPLAARLEVADDGPDERWLEVRLPGGDTGFVQAGDVKPVDPASPRRRGSRDDIVATARRFTGTPYLWGGMTVHGIDCSGLVSRVYHANGFELPRDADLQFADPNADAVAREKLEPGDLLFFGDDEKSITHVGLYLGDGRFINATTHEVPSVHEDRLDDPHWSAIYQGARRPR